MPAHERVRVETLSLNRKGDANLQKHTSPLERGRTCHKSASEAPDKPGFEAGTVQLLETGHNVASECVVIL